MFGDTYLGSGREANDMRTDPPDEASDSRSERDELSTAVASFLRKNFPQIGMHGGEAAILGVDPESGEVWIQLSGTCGGCGVSPMTSSAIQQTLPVEIPDVRRVHIETA